VIHLKSTRVLLEKLESIFTSACVKSFIEHAKLTPFKPSTHLDKANFGSVNSTFFLLGKTISRMIAAPVLLNIFGYMFCLLRES
jgi:hypothetical protein